MLPATLSARNGFARLTRCSYRFHPVLVVKRTTSSTQTSKMPAAMPTICRSRACRRNEKPTRNNQARSGDVTTGSDADAIDVMGIR